MKFDIPAALSAMPERLAALLLNQPDPYIDAEVREAEELGMFDGVAEAEIAKQRFYLRIELLGHEMQSLVNVADGSEVEREARWAAKMAAKMAA